MDEYDYKLSRGNPILTARAISSIIDVIQEKHKSESTIKNNRKEIAELKYLKEKCACGDPVICKTASRGLVYLVKCETIEITNTMSELVAMVPHAKNYGGIIIAITDFLIMDLEAKFKKVNYKCPFTLTVPQHPLISVLVQNSNSWTDILSCISKFYKTDDNEVTEALNELFEPLYLFIFCDPFLKLPQLCRSKFFNFIIGWKRYDLNLLLNIIGWLQVSSNENLLFTSNFLIDLLNSQCIHNDDDFKEFLLLWLTSILYEQCTNRLDPTETISCIMDKINKVELQSTSPTVMILSNCLNIVPCVYLNDLLELCIQVINKERTNVLVLQSLKASLLNWMMYPSLLTESSIHLINDILFYIDSNVSTHTSCKLLKRNKYLSLYQNTNHHLHMAVELSILGESFSSVNIVLSWLNEIKDPSLLLLRRLHAFISGIFLYNYSVKITLITLNLLLKYTEMNKDVASTVLTLILYKLSNNTNSEMHFKLIKALPKMGVLKENLHVVVSTLQAISKNSLKLRTFAMSLYYDLWVCEPKTYPYLQKLLVEDNKMDGIEFYITKSHILKQLCVKRPELYGTELASHLSKVLNQCKNDNEKSVASAFALDGLKHLCTEGLIDIVTAWDTLLPSFAKENRTIVIKSFCQLLSEVPTLYTDTEKYDKMMSEVVTKLWNYTIASTDIEVMDAAYKALSCFNITDLSKQFPDIYYDQCEEIGCNIYGYIPGKYWLLLLQNGNHSALTSATEFIMKLVSQEVSDYSKSDYYIPENRGEPHNYNSLPEHSIVKVLVHYIKSQQVYKNEIALACLKILSQEYNKPLPPLDWCFLQELVHMPQFRNYCISLASHQVVLSGTARRFMENFVIAVTENNNNIEDILCIVKNLKHLCNSIQPIIIKPFMEKTFHTALILIKKQDSLLFDELIERVKEVIVKEDLHEANKNILAQVVVANLIEMDISSQEFKKALDLATLLTFKFIKEISSPKQWSELTSLKFKRAVLIRCALAKKQDETALIWLNEIIDVSGFLKDEQKFVFSNINDVLHLYKDHNNAPNWILELIGQIQVNLADEHEFIKQVAFMCDTFMFSVLILSGYNILLQNCEDIYNMKLVIFLFPQALVLLLKQDEWNKYVSQMLEWLYYMIHFENIPAAYKESFCQALLALKNELVFRESYKWMKYLGCNLRL